jgi:hypothetical protein
MALSLQQNLRTPMQTWRALPVLVLAGISLLGTTLEQLSLDDMVKKSTSIVRGKVVSSAPMQRGNVIYTSYRVQVSDRLKGDAGQTVEVAVPGGRSGQLRQTIPGAPSIEAGKDYVIFIWKGPSGTNHIVGLSQGLFDVQRTSNGELVLKRAAADARMVDAQGHEVQDQAVTIGWKALQRKVAGQ